MRTRWLAGLVALAVLAWPAAPAGSLSGRAAAPADFEQPLPGAARAAGGPFLSPPVRAPARFDLVGVAGALGPVSYRVRVRGGRWSPWTEADAGDPVWAGGADEVQVRSEHGRPGSRLHYVVVPASGGSPRAAGAQEPDEGGEPDAGLDQPAGSEPPSGPEPVGGAPARPAIVSRDEWGAEESCRPRAVPAYGEVKAAVVHHTVSANDYGPERARSVVLGICRYHRNANGWNDIGYNALVDRYGVLYEGRAGGLERAVVGAHAQGYNSQTTGIASLGTHTSVPLGDAPLAALARYLSWKLSLHGVPARGTVGLVSRGGGANRYRAGTPVQVQRILGHRDVDSTACPGGRLYEQLDLLRARVRTGPVKVPLVSLEPSPQVLDYPEQTVLAGRVMTAGGDEPLTGAPVRVQVLGRRGWRALAEATAGGDGGFEAVAAPAIHRYFRALVPALGGYRQGISTARRVLVRPAVESRLSSRSRLEAGGAAIVAGSIEPRKPRLVMAVLRRGRDGRYRRLARVSIAARGGRYRARYRLRVPGSYRFLVVFKRDRQNSSARAPDLRARVEPDSGGKAPPREEPSGGLGSG